MILRRLMLLALSLCFWSDLAAAQGPLDGLQYAIDFAANKDDTPDKPPGSDTLVFTAGNGSCTKAAKAYGYKEKAYEASKKKEVVSFTFTMESPKHGQLTFTGQIQGNTIQGKRTWSKPGKTEIVHDFSGTKQ